MRLRHLAHFANDLDVLLEIQIPAPYRPSHSAVKILIPKLGIKGLANDAPTLVVHLYAFFAEQMSTNAWNIS